MQITIDKQKVDVVPGETILETAEKAGIYIPTLSYQEACGGQDRYHISTVEVKNGNTISLVESCTYRVIEEIEVRTSTPVIKELHRSLALFLKQNSTPGIPLNGNKEHEMFYVVVDREGYISNIDEAYLDIWGLDREDVIGQYILNIFPDSQLPQMLKIGATEKVDILPVNGRNTLVTHLPMNKNNEIIGAIAHYFFLDGSGLQFFNDKVQNVEMDFPVILENIIDNPYIEFIMVDKKGFISNVNHTFLSLLELRKEDIVGKYILDVFPHSELPEILETGRVDKAKLWSFKGHDAIVTRMPIVKKGEIVGAIAHSFLLELSGTQIFMKKLAESGQEYTSIIEGLLENPLLAYIIVNKDGLITAINQACLDTIEMGKEEAIGYYVLDVVPNSELPEILRTGRTDKAELWPINGHDTIVNRVPILKDDEIIGAIGYSLFLEMSGAKILAQKLQETERELNHYKNEISQIYKAKWEFSDLIGESSTFTMVRSLAERLSFTTSTLLITGESGTGKELFAQAIHNSSNRSSGPFIRINCVALPENLMESELFGYEEGAFTGSKKGGKPGKFELAFGGTILLDEIGDMPLSMQTKLLVVLQEKIIERVGGTNPIPIDVRVMAATNRDLEKMVADHEFREDLYYRLNVVRLNIPSLRERMEDLPILCKTLINRINRNLGTNVENISEQAMELLKSYSWPGNIRELENLLERGINLAFMNQENCLSIMQFPSLMENSTFSEFVASSGYYQKSLPQTVKNIEKEMIIQALAKTGGNKIQSARLLGIHTSALYRKISKYGIQ